MDVDKELSAADRRKLNKEIEAKQRKAQREKQALENEILILEEKIKSIESKMCSEENLSNYELLTSLGTELEQAKSDYEEKFEKLIMLEEDF